MQIDQNGQTVDETAHLVVTFYDHAVHNKRKSAEQGYPIYDTIEMCKVRIAGDSNTVIDTPALHKSFYVRGGPMQPGRRISYAERFPREYEAYKAGREQQTSGLPISELPFLTEGERKTLREMNIHSAQALIAANSSKLPMGYDLHQEKSKAFLDSAKGSAAQTELVEKNRALEDKMETLQQQLNELLSKKKADAEMEVNLTVEPDETSDETVDDGEEVTKPGPFSGYNKQMLRDFIAEKTGERVKGPRLSLKSLLEMAEEQLAAAD